MACPFFLHLPFHRASCSRLEGGREEERLGQVPSNVTGHLSVLGRCHWSCPGSVEVHMILEISAGVLVPA